VRRAVRVAAAVVLAAGCGFSPAAQAADVAPRSSHHDTSAAVSAATSGAPLGQIVASGPASNFVPVGPIRLADTRQPVCGCTVVDPSTVRIAIAGQHGVPNALVAAAVTVTGAGASADGFVTVHPTGASRPTTSMLNLHRGRDTANSTIVAVGPSGAIDVFVSVHVDLVVDVTGVFVESDLSAAGRFVSVTPTRLVDTRERSVPGTLDGLAAGGSVAVPLPLGVDSDARAIVVNVTTVGAPVAGFVTGYATGATPAATSFLNPDGTGGAIAASVVLPVSRDGATLTTSAGGHLVVDIVGWFTGASAPEATDGLFVPVAPSRLLDTRVDGPRLWPSGAREVAAPVGGASAIVTNLTIDRADAAGYVTAHAAGTARGDTSSLNARTRDDTVPNLAVTPVSTRGTSYFSSAGTDLVVDVMGYFTGTEVQPTLPVPPNVAPEPRVLLIGDSTLAALNVTTASRTALRGFTPVLDAEPCRRLLRPSCRSRFTLRIPDTAVEAIGSTPGSLDVVVIKAGYNDGTSGFEDAVRHVVAAARAKGARNVIWLTYSEGSGHQLVTYPSNNATLVRLASNGELPELVIADWRTYASTTSGWYASDRVHLQGTGAWATADYISRWVAHVVRRPCAMPWVAGGTIDDPCPNPDQHAAAQGGVPQLRALYGF
jgi:hypothetical protein